MMEMGGNPAAAFWGARHPTWAGHSHQAPPVSTNGSSDPKMAEKLMTELQVRRGSAGGREGGEGQKSVQISRMRECSLDFFYS